MMGMTGFLGVLSNLCQLVAAGFAGWSGVRRARRSVGSTARGWWAISLSVGAWMIGEGFWTWWEVVLRTAAPYPSVADVGFLASIPFAMFGLMSFISTPAGYLSRIRAVTEAAVITCGLLLISWIVLLGDVVRASHGGPLVTAVSLAYPIGDCMLVAMAVFAITRRSDRDVLTVAALAAGFAAIAVADTVFSVLQQSGSYVSGHVADIGWVAGFLLIGAAARRESVPGAPHPGRVERGLVRVRPFVPPLVGGVATALDLTRGGFDSSSLTIAAVSVVLLVVLQLDVAFENQALTADLEARVARRTRQLAEREAQFAALVEHSSDVTFVLDRDGIVSYVSGSARTVMSLEPLDVWGSAFVDLVDPADRERTMAAVFAGAPADTPIRVEVMLAGGGRLHALELTITDLLAEPAIGAIVVNGRDVSERRMFEEQLRHDAMHDSLTGLPNRRFLLEHLQGLLDGWRAGSDTTTAVAMIDLDDFKSVNDGFGHQVGDEYLVEVARRLRGALRPQDVVARLGGDEFAVVVTTTDAAEARAAGERLLDVLQLPVELAGVDMAGRASIGLRIVTPNTTPVLMLRDADVALYAAKSAGKGRLEVFAPELGERAARRLTLKADLRHAWRRGEISVVFQPIVDLATRRLRGAEALVRWTHPLFGSVSPVEFIPLAEDTGVILELGRAVLEDACRHAERWCRSATMSYISVNVSPVQLADPAFPSIVDEALAASGLRPAQLLLEVTEGVLFTNFDAAVSVLTALRDRGVRTAIDDFGTGYSSLAYAQRLPIDVVKIDRAFVLEAGKRSSIIPAIMQIAGLLDADVVAEGIETDDQAGILGTTGCVLGQGYLYSPPVPATSFERFLDSAEIRPAGAVRTGRPPVPADLGSGAGINLGAGPARTAPARGA